MKKLLLIITLLTFSVSAFGQFLGQTGIVSGRVYDVNGRGVQGVRVSNVVRCRGYPRYSATTNSFGFYAIFIDTSCPVTVIAPTNRKYYDYLPANYMFTFPFAGDIPPFTNYNFLAYYE